MKNITLKLGNVLNISERFATLLNKEMSVKLSYKLSKIINILNGELSAYTLSKNKLLDKYADKDSKGHIVTNSQNEAVFKLDNKNKFIEEHDALLDIDADLKFDPIPFSDLEDLKLTVNEMMALEHFLTDVNM